MLLSKWCIGPSSPGVSGIGQCSQTFTDAILGWMLCQRSRFGGLRERERERERIRIRKKRKENPHNFEHLYEKSFLFSLGYAI
jgi:hypothetical protein